VLVTYKLISTTEIDGVSRIIYPGVEVLEDKLDWSGIIVKPINSSIPDRGILLDKLSLIEAQEKFPEYEITEYIPEKQYNKFLTGSELIKLAGLPYGAIENAASAGDNVAAYFVAIGREINAEGAKIWVGHADYIAAVNHFLSKGYIDTAKHDEMLLGDEL
jgi:hypothetical protein